MEENPWRKGLKIAMTIVGTTVGAGFASGREIWEFFGIYGKHSSLGILLFMLLFAGSSWLLLWIAWHSPAGDYNALMKRFMPEPMAIFYDVMMGVMLFSTTVVMLAGSGAALINFGFSFFLGVIILAAGLITVLMFDIEGIYSLNMFLVPMLITVLISVSVHAIRTVDSTTIEMLGQVNANGLLVWPSAVIYVSSNLMFLLGIFSVAGTDVRSKTEISVSAVLSALILGGMAILLNESMLKLPPETIASYDIVLFGMIQSMPPLVSDVISLTLWLAIFTTALSSLYNLSKRIQSWILWPVPVISFCLIMMMFPLSFFGFATLVKFLYPMYGVISLYVLASLFLYPFHR